MSTSGLNLSPPDLEFKVLTALSHMPPHFHLRFSLSFIFFFGDTVMNDIKFEIKENKILT